MLDPSAPAAAGGGGGPAMPFAPERRKRLPPDVALAYASVLKAPAGRASLDSAGRSWGAAFGGGNQHERRSAGVGSQTMSPRATRLRRRPRLSRRRPTRWWALRSPAAAPTGGWRQARQRAQRRVPGRPLRLRAFGPAYLSGALAFASIGVTTNRTVTVAGTDQLTAKFNAPELRRRGWRAATAIAAQRAPFGVTPYAAVQAQSFRTPGYSESGLTGGAVRSRSRYACADRHGSALGTRRRFDRSSQIVGGMPLDLFGRARLGARLAEQSRADRDLLGLPAASFVVNGAAPPTNSALAHRGRRMALAHGWSFLAKFDGEFAGGSQTYTGTARVKYSW